MRPTAIKLNTLTAPSCYAGIGIGTDILHLPRLHAILFDRHRRKEEEEEKKKRQDNVFRFARRILSLEEFGVFGEKFLGGGGGGGGIQRQIFHGDEKSRKELVRWLGVRWTSKEAIYKAYPHPHPYFPNTPEMPSPRLSWKGVTVAYRPSGQPYLKISRILRTLRKPTGHFVDARHDWVDFTGSFSHLPQQGKVLRRGEEEEDGGNDFEDKEVTEEALLTISHDGDYLVAFAMYSPQQTKQITTGGGLY